MARYSACAARSTRRARPAPAASIYVWIEVVSTPEWRRVSRNQPRAESRAIRSRGCELEKCYKAPGGAFLPSFCYPRVREDAPSAVEVDAGCLVVLVIGPVPAASISEHLAKVCPDHPDHSLPYLRACHGPGSQAVDQLLQEREGSLGAVQLKAALDREPQANLGVAAHLCHERRRGSVSRVHVRGTARVVRGSLARGRDRALAQDRPLRPPAFRELLGTERSPGRLNP